VSRPGSNSMSVKDPYTREVGHYFNWEKYINNFNTWIAPVLREEIAEGTTLILYTKESSFASRQSNRKRKIEAIEFMDNMLREALSLLKGEVVVVVASDHSCNIGGHDNPSLNTSYAFATVLAGNNNNRKAIAHFDEAFVKSNQSSKHAVSQAELNAAIWNARES